jgi:hypothetical protein
MDSRKKLNSETAMVPCRAPERNGFAQARIKKTERNSSA